MRGKALFQAHGNIPRARKVRYYDEIFVGNSPVGLFRWRGGWQLGCRHWSAELFFDCGGGGFCPLPPHQKEGGLRVGAKKPQP